jgi:uncharacterized Rmd1/YagE family protein
MTGKARLNRTGILKLIGSALLVQHRVSGRSPLPRSLTRSGTGPDLERLYARVKDKYERRQRFDALTESSRSSPRLPVLWATLWIGDDPCVSN